jgi:hypothetical protein
VEATFLPLLRVYSCFRVFDNSFEDDAFCEGQQTQNIAVINLSKWHIFWINCNLVMFLGGKINFVEALLYTNGVM